MNEIFKLLQRLIGRKLNRREQRHWTRTINQLIDDRVRLIQRYSESNDLLGFDEWVLLQEGGDNNGF